LLKYLALHLTIRFLILQNWLQIITKTNKNRDEEDEKETRKKI
jgi:hypothetical protein